MFMLFLVNSGITSISEDLDIPIPEPIIPATSGFVENAIVSIQNTFNYLGFYFQVMSLNSDFAFLNFLLFLPMIAIIGFILIKDIIIPLLQALADALPF